MVTTGKAKKPHAARRRLVGIGLGAGTVIVGLFVLGDQAWVAGQLQPYIGSAIGAQAAATGGVTPYGSLSYIVYAIGLGLVVSGIGLVRSVTRQSVSSYVSGGGPGAMGMDPAAIQGMMSASMARMSSIPASPAPATEVVKVKCRNCGALQTEDAAFCSKCGGAI